MNRDKVLALLNNSLSSRGNKDIIESLYREGEEVPDSLAMGLLEIDREIAKRDSQNYLYIGKELHERLNRIAQKCYEEDMEKRERK